MGFHTWADAIRYAMAQARAEGQSHRVGKVTVEGRSWWWAELKA